MKTLENKNKQIWDGEQSGGLTVPCERNNIGYLGSQVTPPHLGCGELAGSNPAYPTKLNRVVPQRLYGLALGASVRGFDSLLLYKWNNVMVGNHKGRVVPELTG